MVSGQRRGIQRGVNAVLPDGGTLRKQTQAVFSLPADETQTVPVRQTGQPGGSAAFQDGAGLIAEVGLKSEGARLAGPPDGIKTGVPGDGNLLPGGIFCLAGVRLGSPSGEHLIFVYCGIIRRGDAAANGCVGGEGAALSVKQEKGQFCRSGGHIWERLCRRNGLLGAGRVCQDSRAGLCGGNRQKQRLQCQDTAYCGGDGFFPLTVQHSRIQFVEWRRFLEK